MITLDISDILFEIVQLSTDGEIPQETRDEIEQAILDERFEFLKRDGSVIGFYTWHCKDDGILINNMCILREFRNRDNLLFMREHMRNKLGKDKTFYWKNRKKQKEMTWVF